MDCQTRNKSTVITVVFFSVLLLFVLYRVTIFYQQAFSGFAWDFAVNRTAAIGLQNGISLYDNALLHEVAVAQTGNNKLFVGRFTSFIGLPTTAMLHWPFTKTSFVDSVYWYRISAVLAMLLGVFLTGCAAQTQQRQPVWCVGVLCLILWRACSESIQLGQVDAWIMLSLAATVLALSRKKFVWAGVAVSIAVLLKISPVWLLLYGVIKKQWWFVLSAVVCVMLGLLLSLLPLHGGELQHFFVVVLPSLSDSPMHPQNQSLGAALARVFSADNNWSFAVGIGGWKWAGVCIAAALLFVRCANERSHPSLSLAGVAVAILCALIAGPLTWDHYLAWAIIPVMLLAGYLRGWQWLLLLVALLPMYFPVPYPTQSEIMAHAVWRMAVMGQMWVMLLIAGVLCRCETLDSLEKQ